MDKKIVRARDFRHTCGRLLFRARLSPGTYIEIRCPKCGEIHVIQMRDDGDVLPLTPAVIELVSEISAE